MKYFTDPDPQPVMVERELVRGDILRLRPERPSAKPNPADEVEFLCELDFDPRNNSDVHTLFCKYTRPNTGWCVLYLGEVESVNGKEVIR